MGIGLVVSGVRSGFRLHALRLQPWLKVYRECLCTPGPVSEVQERSILRKDSALQGSW